MDISKYFETRTRDNGEQFVTLTDGRPEWLYDAVMAAHDGELPNDWRYETIRAICDELDEGDFDGSDFPSGTIADALTDQNNYDFMSWLGGELSRSSYVDDASNDGLVASDAGIFERIQVGQYECIYQMVGVLIEAIRENAEQA